MRFLKVLVLVPLVALAACDQKKSDMPPRIRNRGLGL